MKNDDVSCEGKIEQYYISALPALWTQYLCLGGLDTFDYAALTLFGDFSFVYFTRSSVGKF